MDLTLQVIRYQNAPPRQTMSFTVGEGGCNIGRGEDNDFVLPDPERWVSSKHARIGFRNGRFFLIDESSNGTFLNNAAERVPRGDEIELSDGDELTIGSYDIRVSISKNRGAETQALDPFEHPGFAAGATDAFDPFAQQKPTDDQFGSGECQQAAGAGGDLLHRPLTESDQSPELPAGEAAPDILDLVGAGAEADRGLTGPAARGFEEQPLGRQAAPSLDTEGLLPHEPSKLAVDQRPIDLEVSPFDAKGSQPNHTPQEDAFFQAPEAIPEDYDLLGPEPEFQEESLNEEGPSVPLEGSQSEPEWVPLEPAEKPGAAEAVTDASAMPSPGPAPIQEASPVVPSKPEGSEDGAVAAFLTGLGYTGEAPSPEKIVELMQTAGTLLRAMTEGLISIMRSRSTFKSELRIQMTTMRSVENNPFKFSVDADDALNNLLFHPTKGFLPPLQAAHEAIDDMQAHEMAMLAGLRATLQGLLTRFDPASLEGRFRSESVLNNLLPMAKKAKCWDLLGDVYAEVAADTGDDFLNLFGDAFIRAYEDQIHRLKEGHHRPAER